MEVEQGNSKVWEVEVSTFLYFDYCHCFQTVHSSLSRTSFIVTLRFWIGGGSHVGDDAANPSTKKHVGSFNGYVIIRKSTGLGSPGPGGKSNKKEGEKKKGKGGKTAQVQLFT